MSSKKFCCKIDQVLREFGLDNSEVATCGRPLGMAFDTISENLIVMHSSDGVFVVDVKTGKQKRLVSNSDVIGDDVSEFLSSFKSISKFFLTF